MNWPKPSMRATSLVHIQGKYFGGGKWLTVRFRVFKHSRNRWQRQFKHLTVFSPETVNIKKLANLTANNEIFGQKTLKNKRQFRPSLKWFSPSSLPLTHSSKFNFRDNQNSLRNNYSYCMKSLKQARIHEIAYLWIGKITTQQAIKENQVKNNCGVYFIENPTWIPIQIFYYVFRAILRITQYERVHESSSIRVVILSLSCPCSHRLTLCWYHWSNLSWNGC